MHFCQKTEDMNLGSWNSACHTKGKQVTNVFYKNSMFLRKPDFDETIKLHEYNLNFELSTFFARNSTYIKIQD